MLLVANGAFKSGSTWMYWILLEVTGFPLVPDEYRQPRWSPSQLKVKQTPLASIAPNRLKQVLNELDYHESDFITKNHFRSARQRRLLLANDDVLVINIIRDLKDVVVSAYFHDRRVKYFRGDFRQYYWGFGRMRALQVLSHHRRWSIESPKVFTSSYERLHDSFEDEVRTFGRLVDRTLTDDEIALIRRETSLEALRRVRREENTEEKFFRKGIIGDWQNHFDPAMVEDIERIIAGNGWWWKRTGDWLRAFFRVSPILIIRSGTERIMRFLSDRGKLPELFRAGKHT